MLVPLPRHLLCRGKSVVCEREPVFYIHAGCLPAAGPGAAAGWVRDPRGLCTSREGALRWGEDKNKERSHLPLGNLALVHRGCSVLWVLPPSPHYNKLCQGQLKHPCLRAVHVLKRDRGTLVSTRKNLKSPASIKHTKGASPVFWQLEVFSFPVFLWKISSPTVCPPCGDRVTVPCCGWACFSPALLAMLSQRSG